MSPDPHYRWLSCFLTLSFLVLVDCELTERPRGVSLQAVAFYKADDQGFFTCIDGNGRIPFDQVNDDYCDCEDSSDEPGTAACPAGRFTCMNRGFVPIDILSSRVNDHVCDCCDGSDEYNSGKKCKDTCSQEREKQMQKFKTLNAGYLKRQEIIKEAAKELGEKKAKLVEIEKKVQQENDKLSVLEEKKNEAEAPEKEAKEKHEELVREAREKRENELMMTKSADAFEEIDSNKDQKVSLDELTACASLDGNTQCGVTEDEIKEWYPVDVEALNIDQFRDLIWKGKLDSLYRSATDSQEKEKDGDDQGETTETPETDDADYPVGEDDDNDDEGEYDAMEDKEDEDDPEKFRRRHPLRKPGNDKEAKEEDIPMDEETRKIIDSANEARQAWKEQKKVVENVENEKNDLDKQVNLDLGPENSFYSLLNQCFDFKEKEYTYTFCPFDKASQKPKNGGETSLGRWGEWAGPSDNKYLQMKMTKGQRCWNGPDRSLTVHFQCGEDNQILSTSEPSMCEYVMSFKTPAICTQFYDFDTQKHIHEDL